MHACSPVDLRGSAVRPSSTFRPLLLVLIWLTALPVALAQVVDPAALYEGEAPVPDQSDEARVAALPQALAQVLVKLTGNADAPLLPGLRERLPGAADALQHYRYRSDVVVVEGPRSNCSQL
jgi:hypothetical protein